MSIPRPMLSNSFIGKITQAIDEGVDSLEELCRRTGIGRGKLHELEKENLVQLPSTLRPWRYRPEIDALIDEGKSFPEMATTLGCSRQNVYTYLNLSGQREYWKQRRKEAKAAPRLRKEELQKRRLLLLNLLGERTLEVAEREGWVQRKAVEYAFGRKSRNARAYSFSVLVSLFEAYNTARQRGEKLSVAKLGEHSGISFTVVGRVLRAVGEEPMYRIKIRKPLTGEQKKAIRRAHALGFSAPDVAYFLNVPCYVVSQGLRLLGPRERRRTVFVQRDHPPRTRRELTYRLASQVYEARDAGFQVDGLAQLLDTSEEIVTYALIRQEEIEQEIISALRVLYPTKEIDKPYLLGVQRDYVKRPWEHERYKKEDPCLLTF